MRIFLQSSHSIQSSSSHIRLKIISFLGNFMLLAFANSNSLNTSSFVNVICSLFIFSMIAFLVISSSSFFNPILISVFSAFPKSLFNISQNVSLGIRFIHLSFTLYISSIWN